MIGIVACTLLKMNFLAVPAATTEERGIMQEVIVHHITGITTQTNTTDMSDATTGPMIAIMDTLLTVRLEAEKVRMRVAMAAIIIEGKSRTAEITIETRVIPLGSETAREITITVTMTVTITVDASGSTPGTTTKRRKPKIEEMIIAIAAVSAKGASCHLIDRN